MYLVNRYDYVRDVDGLNIANIDDGPTELVSSVECDTWDRVVRCLRSDVGPGAYTMEPRDVVHQLNNLNGGELLILCAGSSAPLGNMTDSPCPVCGVLRHRSAPDHAPGASDPYS